MALVACSDMLYFCFRKRFIFLVGELSCGSFLRKEPGKSWQSNRKNLYINTLSDLTLRYGTNGK